MFKKVMIILIALLFTVALVFIFLRGYRKSTSTEDYQNANSSADFINCVLDKGKHMKISNLLLISLGNTFTIGFNKEMSTHELDKFLDRYNLTPYRTFSTINVVSVRRKFGWLVTTVCRVEQDSRVKYTDFDSSFFATN